MRLMAIWDYFMRRKPLLVALFVLFASGVYGYNAAMQREGRRVDSHFATEGGYGAEGSGAGGSGAEGVVKTVDNGLIAQILDENQAPVVKITFGGGGRQARVEVGANSLASGAYVRIFDAGGGLVAGEYTQVYDGAASAMGGGAAGGGGAARVNGGVGGASAGDGGVGGAEAGDGGGGDGSAGDGGGVRYYFPDTPKDYSVALAPGMRVELQARTAKFYSTLDGAEVAEYAPKTEVESYIVTEKGLRRADFSEAEAEAIMYRQLKRYADREINQYRASIPEHVLYNKTLDVAKKAEITQLYAELAAADRSGYTEFVEQLRKGGAPVITYRGAAEYKREEKVDLLGIISVHDNEDGEIASGKVKVERVAGGAAGEAGDGVVGGAGDGVVGGVVGGAVGGVVDFTKAGDYDVIYSVSDSDGNVTQLKVTIRVLEERAEAPGQMPGEDRPVQGPTEGNNGGGSAGDVGGAEAGDGGGGDGGGGDGSAGDGGISDRGENGGAEAGVAPILDEAGTTGEAGGASWGAAGPKVDYVDSGAPAETGAEGSGEITEPSVAMIETETGAGANKGAGTSGAATQPTERKTEKVSEKTAAETGAEAKALGGNVVFIIVGLVAACGVVKFISDRYVR